MGYAISSYLLSERCSYQARDSAPRFAQANHLLLGGWGAEPVSSCLRAATSAETADSPAFFAGRNGNSTRPEGFEPPPFCLEGNDR